MIRTVYNQFRLGDCLWTSHWLRHAALANLEDEFIFFCPQEHHWQLAPLFEGVNVKVGNIHRVYPVGTSTWINADGIYPPADRDIIGHIIKTFTRVAERLGIAPILQKREEWLFDYPALVAKPLPPRSFEKEQILFVDSAPMSGQFAYDRAGMDRLSDRLEKRFNLFYTDCGDANKFCSATEWGCISMACSYVVMVATGPSWPTFSAVTESRIKNRFILLHDKEFINYGREWPHFSSVAACEKHLETLNLI